MFEFKLYVNGHFYRHSTGYTAHREYIEEILANHPGQKVDIRTKVINNPHGR